MGIALGIVLVVALGAVAFCISGVTSEYVYEQDSELAYNDKPLMTEEEKEAARESGVASYRVGDTVYFDESLPPEYYEEG